MAIAFTSNEITAANFAVTSSGNITPPANTKAMLFFVFADGANTAANNTDPNIVRWNSINATKIYKVADSAGGQGQCLSIYKIDNPASITALAEVQHLTQYHHQVVVCVTNDQPITINISPNTNFATGTNPSVSVDSVSGDKTIFAVISDALTGASQITINGGSSLLVSGGGTRQTFKMSTSTSSGVTQSESWTLATSQRWSTVAVNIADGVFTVDTINGSSSNPAIDVSSSNTANTTGLGTITSLTISDGTRSLSGIQSMPSGDGTFAFTWPYADGVVAPLFGSVTATFGNGTRTVGMVSTTSIPSGFASVTFLGATDISEYHLGHVLTLTDGKRMYYPTTNGAVINSDGSLEFTALPYTLNAMLHNVHSGGDGTITSVTVVITESGAVAVTGGGLTSSGLTSSGLTRVGLTSTGL